MTEEANGLEKPGAMEADDENMIPMDVRNISYSSGRKLTPEERKERRRKRREARRARGEDVGGSDDSDSCEDDEEDEDCPEEIQEGLTEMKVPKLNLGSDEPKLLETDIDAAEDLICPRKVRFGGQMAPPPGHHQAGSVVSTPRSITTDELESRLEDLRRQTDRILYVLDCMDTRLGGPGLTNASSLGPAGPGATNGPPMLNGPVGDSVPGPFSPGSSFRGSSSQPHDQDSIGPELASPNVNKIPGSAFSLPPGTNGRTPGNYTQQSYGGYAPNPPSGSYGPVHTSYGPGSASYGSYAPNTGSHHARPLGSGGGGGGFVGFSGRNSRWGPLGKGSGLGALADTGASPPRISEVQYIEQQTQCLLRDLEALQSIVIPPPGNLSLGFESRPPSAGSRSSLRRTQSLRAPRSRGRSYGPGLPSMDPGPISNSWEYLASLIQIRRSVVGVTDRLRPMDHVMARGRR